MEKLSKSRASKRYLEKKYGNKSKPISNKMKSKLEQASNGADKKIQENNSVYAQSNAHAHESILSDNQVNEREKLFEISEEDFKFKVKWFDINSLVANLSNPRIQMDSETIKELLQTYYYGLKLNKISGFTTSVLTVTNKKKLYSYLLDKKLILDDKTIINDQLDNYSNSLKSPIMQKAQGPKLIKNIKPLK